MSRHITVTCDLCKQTWQEGEQQMWYAGVFYNSAPCFPSYADPKYQIHICRNCTEDMRLVPIAHSRPKSDLPLPEPAPTIEDLIRTIIDEVLNECT